MPHLKKTAIILLVILLTGLCPFLLQAQQDSRYDSGLNLPFNEKAGEVNPQTGNITIRFTDVQLPGRAGLDFSFSRIWALNQANVFAMNRDIYDGSNYLSSDTIEQYNHLGAGWSSSLPYVFTDEANGVKSLFFGGSVYELNQTTLAVFNSGNSNITGYDLLDLRVYTGTAGSAVSYGDYNGGVLPTGYPIDDTGTDYSEYVLILKDNSRYYFRPDGRLMMQQDRTGLNRIWYFYGDYTAGKSRLVLVVDTVGREIVFGYNGEGNLASIRWEVLTGKKQPDGSRTYAAATRSVQYSYVNAETGYSAIAALADEVVHKQTPYALATVTDTEANVMRYEYETGSAFFSYNSAASFGENLFLLLTAITTNYTAEGFKSRRCFEYDIPAGGLYTREFYLGYMEYYKLSRQYLQDRQGRIMHDTTYLYYKPGQGGNYNVYTTMISKGNLTTTYTYTLSSRKNQDNVLDKIKVESTDGFLEVKDFVYDNLRTKVRDEVHRNGSWVYAEQYEYDAKGNLKRYIDRLGLETSRQYHSTYAIPTEEIKKLQVDGKDTEYKSTNTVNSLGQVTEQYIYLNGNGTVTPVRTVLSEYDQYGNVIRTTDAAGNVMHTVYDGIRHAFPVKSWQTVTIADWTAGSPAANWRTSPDTSAQVQIRNWSVFNTDGTVWMNVDNEGYAIEHYYDTYGRERETVQPDGDDLHAFAIGNDFTDFRADYLATNFAAYFTARQNNPGIRVEIDDQADYIRTTADVDVSAGRVKVMGVQGDGLGNTEEEIEYGENGVVHAVKRMAYDAQGRMIALTDPDAGTTFTELDVHGTTIKRYDKTWIVKYDDVGRQKRVIYPETTAGRLDVKEISYNDLLNTVTTKDPAGRQVTERFDWSGNLVELKHQGNNSTPVSEQQVYTYGYDKLKRKIRFTDPKGIITTYHYDERNLLLEQNYGQGSDMMVYNHLGQLVKKTDRKGQVIEFIYDELGRNTRVDHYLSAADYTAHNIHYSVHTVYDFRGNAVRIDNQNLVEYYVYDYANRVTKLERYLKDSTIRGQSGEILGIALARGSSDWLGADWLTDNSANWQANAFTGFTLKAGGGAATITGNDATTLWFTDSTIGSTGTGYGYTLTHSPDSFGFQYTYNDAGMVTEMIYPDGSVHSFTYDQYLARLEKIRLGADTGSLQDFVSDIEYNKSAVVTRMDYANSTWQTWEFDNRKRISHINISRPGAEIADLHYTLNSVGDILAINDNEYTYDGFDRISAAHTLIPGNKDLMKLVRSSFGTALGADPVSVEGKVRTYNTEADINSDGRIDGIDHAEASFINSADIYDDEAFSYDKNGNRTRLVQNGDEYTYEYGVRNRLEKVKRKKAGAVEATLYIEYTYDANGNTTRRVIHADGEDKTVTFEYDTMNRLIRTTEGANTTEYYYDNAGNRFIKKLPDGSLTVYLRHGQIAVAMDVELPAVTDEERGTVNRYVLSGDLLAGRVTDTWKANYSVETKLAYYHLDHLNSTKCVTDEAGVVEVMYEYRAFGEQLRRLDGSGAEVDDVAKYSYGGKELDDGTNLYYFNARYYDATIGRFINVDPIQDGTNWYVYCHNNPLAMVDKNGLEPITITIGGVTITVGAAVAIGAAATWSFLMLTSKDFRNANINLATYVADKVTEAAVMIYKATIEKIVKPKTDSTVIQESTPMENPVPNGPITANSDKNKPWYNPSRGKDYIPPGNQPGPILGKGANKGPENLPDPSKPGNLNPKTPLAKIVTASALLASLLGDNSDSDANNEMLDQNSNQMDKTKK